MVSVQVGVEPAHDPPQPVKLEPASGVAVRTTKESLRYMVAQAVPQVTVPFPDLITVNETIVGQAVSMVASAIAIAKNLERICTPLILEL